MLLFINEAVVNCLKCKRFQYITCYSLSYRSKRKLLSERTFQYITCYSLSKITRTSWIFPGCFNTSHVTLYQIILIGMKFLIWCFNTSHVTLYQLMERLLSMSEIGFNTSHVTLYLLFTRVHIATDRVSIHHMLLFIWKLN